MPDQEVRCSACARLLFKLQDGALAGALSIKCPRCRAMNILRPLRALPPERPSRPTVEGSEDANQCKN